MELLLERSQRDPDVTIGALYVEADFECWTLEDPIREKPGQPVSAWKIKGQTAIPFGTYEVDITQSARFGVPLPILLNVPGFDGIRIHPGNTVENTEGCILVGVDRFGKSLGHSRKAFDALFARLRAAKAKGERITIRIV